MKKLFAMLLAASMMMSLAACGSKTEEPAPAPAPEAPSTSEPAAPEAPAEPALETVTEGKLTVATSPDFAPYEFYAIAEDGTPSLAGFDIALAGYVADHMGLELEIIPMDFDGVLMEVATGKVDIGLAGLSPDPDRMDAMDFSDTYYEGKQAFITTKANASKFTDLASTNSADIKIAAQTGTIQMDLAAEFSPDAQLTQLTKATDIIAELISGKLDGAYIEWDVAESYQKNYPELTIVCEVPYEAEGNVIGVAKGNADLLKYVNEALNKCVNEGTFAQFLEEANNLAAGDNYQGLLGEDGTVPTDAG